MYIMNRAKDILVNADNIEVIDIAPRRVKNETVYYLTTNLGNNHVILSEYSSADDAKAAMQEIADAIADGVTLLEMI